MALKKRRPGLVYPVEEDWIYVGSGGSAPAFGSGWLNGEGGAQKCAFRLREAGIVDIVGFVATTTAATRTIFQLPAGYRPSAAVVFPGVRRDGGDLLLYADLVQINTSGYVTVDYASVYAAADKFIVNGSFSLSPAATL